VIVWHTSEPYEMTKPIENDALLRQTRTGVAIWRHLANTIERSCAAAMLP